MRLLLTLLHCAILAHLGWPELAVAQEPARRATKEKFDYFASESEAAVPVKTIEKQPAASKSAGTPTTPSRPQTPPTQPAPRATATTSNLTLQLWMEWGTGTSRQWQGTIRLDKGELSNLRGYGYEADEPGSMYIAENVVHIGQRSPRAYDSLSLFVTAPSDAVLTIDLAPTDQPQKVKRIRVSMAQLFTSAHKSQLDDQGNQLIVRRASGDQLRVKFDRDSFVFAPREKFTFQVVPYLIKVDPDTIYRFQVQLLQARTFNELWSTEQAFQSDVNRRIPALKPTTITMPAAEGVYDVLITIARQTSTMSFGRVEPEHQRKLQLVVVDGRHDGDLPFAIPFSDSSTEAWRRIYEVLPAPLASASKLRSRMSPFNLFQSTTKKSPPTGDGKTTVQTHNDRKYMMMAAGGWQTYQLNGALIGRPNVLEVEYPSDVRQTLGISIIEPNAAGEVVPLGLDSGVDVGPGVGSRGKSGIHRLVFWPRTNTPIVLLTNRSSNAPALYGKIKLIGGPERLPANVGLIQPTHRLMATYYDKPLFPENFCAGNALDKTSGRVLKDWATFYLGGSRLVEYFQHAGYNAAMISVVREGSAIYPSQLLQATPKFDNGVFFATAQDPMQKDVLEMLLRMFDRAGLKLIPAVHFSGTLPELETLRRQDATGIDLVDADGRSWIERFGTRRGAGPHYNPLDPRVQQAMRRVIQEIIQRYSQHPSFAGIAIQLGPQTYAQLPDEDWGSDDATLSRFVRETGTANTDELNGFVAQDRLHQRWLDWRIDKLAHWHRQVQQDLAKAKQGAKLYLAGTEMFSSPQVQDSLRPTTLPSSRVTFNAIRRIGINPHAYEDDESIILLRPERIAPPKHNAIDLELAWSADKDELFGVAPADFKGSVASDSAGQRLRTSTGSLMYHEPRTIALAAFDKVSPFGAAKTHTWLASHISPDGMKNRQRFVHHLAALDSQAMFDGGWMTLLGQEAPLMPFVEVYRRLPAQPFETVQPKDAAAGKVVAKQPRDKSPDSPTDDQRIAVSVTQPVVVRSLIGENETYIYVVNDSPWPVTVSLELSAGTYQSKSLSQRRLPSIIDHEDMRRLTLSLEPYDLIGAVFSSPDAQITDWHAELDHGVAVMLEGAVDEIRARINQRRGPPLSLVKNADFESPPRATGLSGWQHGNGKGMFVELDQKYRRNGRQSLRLESRRLANWSNGPVVWVRSAPVKPPHSRRLAFSAWMRIEDAGKPPSVRMVVEGMVNGRKFLRQRDLGSTAPPGDPQSSLKDTWTSYTLAVDDLLPEGIEELRIGFDLRGTGQVWIDHVEIFGLWLNDRERDELLKAADLAKSDLKHGRINNCRQFLDGYWSQFLRQNVPMAQVARSPERSLPTPIRQARTPSRPSVQPTVVRPNPTTPKDPMSQKPERTFQPASTTSTTPRNSSIARKSSAPENSLTRQNSTTSADLRRLPPVNDTATKKPAGVQKASSKESTSSRQNLFNFNFWKSSDTKSPNSPPAPKKPRKPNTSWSLYDAFRIEQ